MNGSHAKLETAFFTIYRKTSSGAGKRCALGRLRKYKQSTETTDICLDLLKGRSSGDWIDCFSSSRLIGSLWHMCAIIDLLITTSLMLPLFRLQPVIHVCYFFYFKHKRKEGLWMEYNEEKREESQLGFPSRHSPRVSHKRWELPMRIRFTVLHPIAPRKQH